MDKKLIAKHEYVNGPRGLHYHAGEVITVTDAAYLFLMADAPGCFEAHVEPEVKALDAPPVSAMVAEPEKDKMLRQPKVKK